MSDTSTPPRRRWPIIAVLGVVVATATYLLAVRTGDGQAIENAALRGADQASERDANAASQHLDQITVYSLGIAVLVVAAIALLRRRLDLLVAAVGVIVAGQVVVQTLKRYVLPRPELVEVTGHFAQNSLPSGHTTIAMTVLFATIIVVPYRWRGLALIVVLSWAIGIGHYTLTAKWHRLSDTIAADAISLSLACLASWFLVARGGIQRYTGRPKVIPAIVTVLASISVVTSLLMGAVLWGVPLSEEGIAVATHDDEWNIYLGATAFASAGSVIAALIFLAAWHRLETTTEQP
ncbi:phosphatase PAP2 family protein [Nocardia sp. NPDC058658]|uniref:phosphatase PAP2 family protein n=1 Tax=Nocardia sp. NPDC058658 TaxID=3346580 RepID=UPI00364BC1F4